MSEAQLNCDNCGDLTPVSQIQTVKEDGENIFLCPQCWNRTLDAAPSRGRPGTTEGASQPTAAPGR